MRLHFGEAKVKLAAPIVEQLAIQGSAQYQAGGHLPEAVDLTEMLVLHRAISSDRLQGLIRVSWPPLADDPFASFAHLRLTAKIIESQHDLRIAVVGSAILPLVFLSLFILHQMLL